jgi:hypothetical protein
MGQQKYKSWRPTWNAHCDWCNKASEILYDVPDNATGEFDSVCAECADVTTTQQQEGE